jgi:hypothetical protein
VLKGFREPVQAYRLRGRGGSRPADEPADTTAKERISLGAIIFGLLGAPCAITTLVSPLALALGAGGLFGLAAVLTFLDRSAVRIPILALTTLAALANLYTLRHARKLRAEERVPPHLKVMTSEEKRRTTFVLAASLLTLGIVAFEIIAHIMLHDQQ